MTKGIDECPEGRTAVGEGRHQQRKKRGLLCSPFLNSVSISSYLSILDTMNKILMYKFHSNRVLKVFISKGKVTSVCENSKARKQTFYR